MSQEKKEKRKAEIEHPQIQEIEHETLHPTPDMTRDIENIHSPNENNGYQPFNESR